MILIDLFVDLDFKHISLAINSVEAILAWFVCVQYHFVLNVFLSFYQDPE